MNISSENFGPFASRYQNDAVTVMNSQTGHASNFPGGWDKYSAMKAHVTAGTKSGNDFREVMETALRGALILN